MQENCLNSTLCNKWGKCIAYLPWKCWPSWQHCGSRTSNLTNGSFCCLEAWWLLVICQQVNNKYNYWLELHEQLNFCKTLEDLQINHMELFRKPDWGEGKIIRLDKDLKLWCCDTQCCCGNLLWLSEGKTVCWSFLEWVDKFDQGLYNINRQKCS